MWEQVQALPTPQTVRAQRTLRVEHAFWLPPADPDGDMKDRAAEVRRATSSSLPRWSGAARKVDCHV